MIEPIVGEKKINLDGKHAFKKVTGYHYYYQNDDYTPNEKPPVKDKTSTLVLLTAQLVNTYRTVDPENFKYNQSLNPRRVLTKPSERTTENLGHDNIDHNYILYVNDYIGHNIYPNKYKIVELLGKGTFGQVVKCIDTETNELVAVKVVKNIPAYYSQGLYEVRVLKDLNSTYDPDKYCMVQLLESFVFRNHLCLVFELLNVSLYELIKQNQFKGLSLKLISVFMKQILTCLTTLYDSRIIHCDLKPENILLEDATGARVKVIDFGSACYENHHVYSYIQSRFYRSPEVILGHHYRRPIDIWSLGCIAFELFVGLPLFPGLNQHRMLYRFIHFLGHPPLQILREGRDTMKFFKLVGKTGTAEDYVLKTDQEYKETSSRDGQIPPFRDYFKGNPLEKIIMDYSFNPRLPHHRKEEEINHRKCFFHFLNQMLRWDMDERWTPRELLKHPFVTREPFEGDFKRPEIPQMPKTMNEQSRYWPFVGTPSEHSYMYMDGGGMPSSLGTSPSSFSGQYFSPGSQPYFKSP